MVKVPIDFQDYDDDDPELEKRKKRYDYWTSLKKMRAEEWKPSNNGSTFLEWVEETYGFKPKLNDRGITDDYEVVDEKKFVVYILKYGK